MAKFNIEIEKRVEPGKEPRKRRISINLDRVHGRGVPASVRLEAPLARWVASQPHKRVSSQATRLCPVIAFLCDRRQPARMRSPVPTAAAVEAGSGTAVTLSENAG